MRFVSSLYIPVSRFLLLILLALVSSAAGSGFVGASSQSAGHPVLYEAETLFAKDPQREISAYAGAMTIIFFNAEGRPKVIGFAHKNELGQEVVQGEYGVDDNGLPRNKGRLIYKGPSMPYVVLAAKGEYTYHFSYLELTTAGDDAHGYGAFAVKVIAADNKVQDPSGGVSTYQVSEDGQLPISHGKIKIGQTLIRPYYDCSGEVVEEKPKAN